MELYDLHCHTKLSLCAKRDSEIEGFVANALEGGLVAIGFSDHSWDKGLGIPSGFYEHQDYERLFTRVRPEIKGLKVLLGAEGEYAQGLLAVRRETAKKLDYLIVPHSHTHMTDFVLPCGITDPKGIGRYIFASFVSLMHHPNADCIFGVAHPFGGNGKKADEMNEILSYITDAEFEYCGRLAADKGIYLELNTSSAAVYPPETAADSDYARFFRAAKKGGAKFFLGSDNHSPRGKEENRIFRYKEWAEPFGLDDSDFTDALSRILRV